MKVSEILEKAIEHMPLRLWGQAMQGTLAPGNVCTITAIDEVTTGHEEWEAATEFLREWIWKHDTVNTPRYIISIAIWNDTHSYDHIISSIRSAAQLAREMGV